jgi:hypothetical protein
MPLTLMHDAYLSAEGSPRKVLFAIRQTGILRLEMETERLPDPPEIIGLKFCGYGLTRYTYRLETVFPEGRLNFTVNFLTCFVKQFSELLDNLFDLFSGCCQRSRVIHPKIPASDFLIPSPLRRQNAVYFGSRPGIPPG